MAGVMVGGMVGGRVGVTEMADGAVALVMVMRIHLVTAMVMRIRRTFISPPIITHSLSMYHRQCTLYLCHHPVSI